MNRLDTLKEKLESYEKAKNDLLQESQDCDISFFEITPEISNYNDMIGCLKMLIESLEKFESEDKSLRHEGKRDIEHVKRTARGVKHEQQEEIRKAQEIINLMDEIISICNDTK